VVSGGFPCQDIAAGSRTRTGLEGKRSGLWSEMARIICEVGPSFIFLENSPNIISNGVGRILWKLASMGYDARWGVFSGGDVGARHERERFFCIASHNGFLRGTRPWVERKRGELENETINRSTSGKDAERAFVEMAKGHARMDDGLAYPVDAVRCVGNGQIPTVVRLAWETLMGRISSVSHFDREIAQC